MDGTLVDSTAGVVAAWEAAVKKYPGSGLTAKEILSCTCFLWDLSTHIILLLAAAHGVRTAENLRRVCGIEDPDELEVRTTAVTSVKSCG